MKLSALVLALVASLSLPAQAKTHGPISPDKKPDSPAATTPPSAEAQTHDAKRFASDNAEKRAPAGPLVPEPKKGQAAPRK